MSGPPHRSPEKSSLRSRKSCEPVFRPCSDIHLRLGDACLPGGICAVAHDASQLTRTASTRIHGAARYDDASQLTRTAPTQHDARWHEALWLVGKLRLSRSALSGSLRRRIEPTRGQPDRCAPHQQGVELPLPAQHSRCAEEPIVLTRATSLPHRPSLVTSLTEPSTLRLLAFRQEPLALMPARIGNRVSRGDMATA